VKQNHRPKAATKDVLGKASPRIPRKWKKHYERLAELRDLFHAKQESLIKDAREEQPTYGLHMADAGTDAYDRDFALSMLSSEQNALYEIESAMNRIIEGTYGICELTNKPIGEKRLKEIPWTRFSAEAERHLEENGKVERTHLAERGSVVQSEQKPESETD
jgi:RNA polymerase-binding transcription factor DksA